jgi:thiol-disulfide isomerase/thioredoxin
MHRVLTSLSALAVLLLFCLALPAAELGDPAAELDISTWVKGAPVKLADTRGTNVVVVEFWATWCPPCRATIPHLTGLQKKFADRGVIVVGVSSEDEATVKPFVEKMGEQMEYRVAVDNEGRTSQGYMEAFGESGIPYNFVVDKDGRVAWHGYAMQDLDAVVEKLLDGRFDLAAEKKIALARKKLRGLVTRMQKGEAGEEIEELGREIEAMDAEGGGTLGAEGKPFRFEDLKRAMRVSAMVREYGETLMAGDKESELPAMEKKIREQAPEQMTDEAFAAIRLRVAAQRYFAKAVESPDSEELPKLAEALGATTVTNAFMLNELAWALLTSEELPKKDPALGLKLAERAWKFAEGAPGAAAVADTCARALAANERFAEAVAMEEKAISLAEAEMDTTPLKTALEEFRSKLSAQKEETKP